jgi:endogenous inhibitor of DNA gyrase (YacG/DUF329 family)
MAAYGGVSVLPMSSPVERIYVDCPGCGTVFEDWDRASVDAAMAADHEYMRRLATATCPTCSVVWNISELRQTGRVTPVNH